METYVPYSKFAREERWDAIVVGSGMGGMACAAALAKRGRRALLLEQHSKPGGFTHVFSRQGYTWDVGVHCVGEMREKDVPGKLLRWLTGGELEWVSMGPVYETFHFPGGYRVEFPATYRDFKSKLKTEFPAEAASIDAYFQAVWDATQAARVLFASRAIDPRWLKPLSAFKRLDWKRWFARTTEEVMRELVPNERLRSVLTAQWGYYGSTPSRSSFGIHALVVRHFANGGYYPAGGSKSIGDSLLKVVRGAGGETVTRASVERILVDGQRAIGVRMEDGREFRAPLVVSAVGARATTEKLMPEDATDWARELRSMQQSPPHVCLYLGLEGDLEAAGGTRSNQWFFESWNMEDCEWDIDDPSSIASCLYMSFPTLKDPRHDPGPERRHTAEVVTFVPWRSFEKWSHTRRGKREPDYMEFKRSVETRLVAQLRKHVPRIMDLVKHQEFSTPLSTTFYTRAPMGAIYGLEPTPRRFLSEAISTRTPYRGLLMAGGDVATLGVTGALIGGVLAASNVDRRILAKFL